MSAVVELAVPKGIWLTANGRYHWRERARRTRRIRQLAHWEARRQHTPHHDGPVAVTALIQARGRFDPPNAAPAVKAVLDGLTDAGVWDDDDSTRITSTAFGRLPGAPPKGTHTIRITIEEAR